MINLFRGLLVVLCFASAMVSAEEKNILVTSGRAERAAPPTIK
ncbi:translocation protein TolB, partial [Pseudomonas syringae pv. japonica str. M301072]